jgi:hypothetical protein
MESTNPATYNSLENQLVCITNARNSLASQIITILEDAEFHGQTINVAQAQSLTIQANKLLEQVQNLNQGGSPIGCPSYSLVNASTASGGQTQPTSSSPSLTSQATGTVLSAAESQQDKR